MQHGVEQTDARGHENAVLGFLQYIEGLFVGVLDVVEHVNAGAHAILGSDSIDAYEH